MSHYYTEEQLHHKSPQELTGLLYTALIERLEQAAEAIRSRRYIESNVVLKRCNDILYRLGAGLNYEAGIVADQLESIYNYAAETLIQANIHKDAEKVQEVLRIVREIAEAWQTALDKGPLQTPSMQWVRSKAYDQDLHIPNGKVDITE